MEVYSKTAMKEMVKAIIKERVDKTDIELLRLRKEIRKLREEVQIIKTVRGCR